MPYIFPKRKLRSEDVLDPSELNEDFIPAVEVVSGKLNAHNIDEDATLPLETDGSSTPYYTYYYVSAESNPSFGAKGGYQHPVSSATTHIIRNDMEWDLVTTMSVSPVTGLSTLWVTGRVQYIWLGFTSDTTDRNVLSETGEYATATLYGHRWSGGTQPARVQFAIRVNGAVLPHTVTGKIDPFEAAALPLKALEQRKNSAEPEGRFPGPGLEWNSQPTACGPEMLSIRIGSAIQVQPGTHTVEIVARRVPPVGQSVYDGTNLDDTTKWEENFIAVFNRSLFVLDIPTFPGTASSAANVSVDTYDSEEVISAKSLGTDRIEKIKDALNVVEQGSLARGALCRDHLSSAVLRKNTAEVTGDPMTLTAYYPGWITATKASTSSDTGWFLLRDSSATRLKTTTGFNLTTTSIFLVLGNVHVQSLRTTTASRDLDEFGALVIGYEDSGGTFHIIPHSESYVNHYGAFHRLDAAIPDECFKENVDVPLLAVVTSADISSATGGLAIDHFGIYGATMSVSGQPVMTYRRGNITVIQMKV
tara:strand:+ start:4799 stop:6397 length:1599 start_codon:yes stop_codon:yes gene_type:complete